MDLDEDRIPVIIGVGQIVDRDEDISTALDTLGLMKAAVEEADRDSGGGLLPSVDGLFVVEQMTWPKVHWPSNEKIHPFLASSLGIKPSIAMTSDLPSGTEPTVLISEAANQIASGKVKLAVVVGGEALRTEARRESQMSVVTKDGKRPDMLHDAGVSRNNPFAVKYGLVTPNDIYPLYENACRAAWQQSLQEGQVETSKIYAGNSVAAVENSSAWIRKAFSPEEILNISDSNRRISFPFTKLMVANNSVNLGAAVIVTSLANARTLGIPDSRLVFVGAGAKACEPEDIFQRDRFDRSASLEAVIEETLLANRVSVEDIDFTELYSCYPCIPKMARRSLGWPLDRAHSVYGGHTFGGGPMGNGMMHAVAVMADKLREGGRYGFTYANGGYVTLHHAMMLSNRPFQSVVFPRSYDVQTVADAKRDHVPPFIGEYVGSAILETYAVPYDRSGNARFGIVVARNEKGARFVARVPRDDYDGISFLTSGKIEPVGTTGYAELDRDGFIIWKRSHAAYGYETCDNRGGWGSV